MASNELLVKRESGIVTVTLNRPDKMNALNKDMFDALKSLVDVLETDKTARVLILTAAGDKAFCVGADLKERQSMNEKDIALRMEFVRNLYLRLERLPVPIIAAINATALGGGLELALTADLRVAAENVTIGFPETDLAIIPGNGGTQRLPRLIGMQRAMELILMAKRISAGQAMEYGIVNTVVAQGQALNQAMTWATKICEGGPIAIRAAKTAIRGGMERSYEHALQYELECYKSCLYSKDRVEGLKAFNEKRKPEYRGE